MAWSFFGIGLSSGNIIRVVIVMPNFMPERDHRTLVKINGEFEDRENM